MKRRPFKPLRAVLMLVVCAAAIYLPGLCIYRATAQSRGRIEREHGIRLPPSASAFQCAGDAWTGFLDRGASSIFETDRASVPEFVAQLHVHPASHTFVPGNPQYHQLKKPWQPGATPTAVYSCDSPNGDWLHVELYPIGGEERIAVWLYTDWN